MNTQDFAKELAVRFKKLGATEVKVEDRPQLCFSTVTVDLYALGTKTSTYKLEKATCELVKENDLNPNHVRFDVWHGFLCVQLREDQFFTERWESQGPLGQRSVWKRWCGS